MYACLRRICQVEKYNKNSGHLRLCQQPRAAHTLRSDQNNTVNSGHLVSSHQPGLKSRSPATNPSLGHGEPDRSRSSATNPSLWHGEPDSQPIWSKDWLEQLASSHQPRALVRASQKYSSSQTQRRVQPWDWLLFSFLYKYQNQSLCLPVPLPTVVVLGAFYRVCNNLMFTQHTGFT